MVATALSVGGDANDPVVTRSYLTNVLKPELTTQYKKLADKGLSATYYRQFGQLTDSIGSYRLRQLRADTAAKLAQGTLLLKKGDVLTLAPGAKLLLQSGGITADTASLIDVTNGVSVAKNTALKPNIRYMMGDGESGRLLIGTDTCEMQVSGVYTLAASAATDYGSMAQALQTMGLFQGTGTGFSLESGATRAQGLVMFLRILGLEQQALSYTGTIPFTDVPQSHWAYRYVAYAYNKGLTSGTAATRFSPDAAITCQHYATFLLRALHFAEGTDFTYATAIADSSKLGLFSQAEMNSLSKGGFQRFKMVYLSYYGLFGVDQQTGGMLMQTLVAGGAVKEASLYDGLCKIYGTRIS